MIRRYSVCAVVCSLLALAGPRPAELSAQGATAVFISEVYPAGSGNGTYAADWFEVTNPGPFPVDITGWAIDDNSNAFASAVPLRGVTTIPPGRSAVFVEGAANGSTDAAILASFSTAWFGSATPPPGVLIGAYGGSGVGLGNGGDAVNLFDAGGNRITGIAFGATTAGFTFDNAAGLGSTTLPLPVVSTASVVGVNGAFLSFNGAETGSPGRHANPPSLTGIDLSLYVRTGRFDLPEPTRTPPPPGSVLAQEASAVTYNWDTNTLFIVGDRGTSIVQVTKTGQLIDSMTLAAGSSPQGTEFFDPEGLTYVGNGRFVLAEERDRQAVLFTYAAGTTLNRAGAQTVKLGTSIDNTGLEGVSFDPLTSGYVFVKEISPQGIFQTGIDFAAGTATNGSPTTENSTNLFDPALANLLDFADVFALSNLPTLTGPQSTHLLVLSQESGRIVNIDRNGSISSSLTIADPSSPISVPDQGHEGLTMDGEGNLYIVNENGGGDSDHPQLWVYAPSSVPNQPPTAIALENQVNSIAENTSTASRLKVADVVVADDGLGTNNLAVSGPDAAAFEVDSTGLYIRAGTVLDFETQNSYSVTVAVDDPTVGSTPDATADFALTIADIVDENPSLPAVAVTEVSPWSSGNSPYAADWFEVTNVGTTAVNVSGWRMDDDSGAFGSGVALAGVTSIAPGESVIFMETANLADTRAAFLTAWFGANPPAGLQIGSYSGGGVGLSTGGDAVHLFDSGGNRVTGIRFGTSTTGFTFDNAARLGGTTLPLPLVSILSVAGVNGAFVAAGGAETGSPGTIHPDVTPPVIDPVADIAVETSGPAGSAVSYSTPAATDDTDRAVTVNCLPASGSIFPLGETTVTCTARDAAGNTGTATFKVTVTFVEPSGRMLGLGRVDDGGTQHHFAFRVAQVLGRDFGAFNYWVQEGSSISGGFQATSITTAIFFDDPAFTPGASAPSVDSVLFGGTGNWNGRPGYLFIALATDRGTLESGGDTFSLAVVDAGGAVVALVNGSLAGGNIESVPVLLGGG